MNTPIPNTIIRASAGSGKTQKLAERFIELIDQQVPPDRILALTFSRKAAAEFLERILHLLAENPERPDRLRRVIDHLHRLQLSTIDSFFAMILRSFPFEFGIDGEIAVIDETRAISLLEDTLAATLEDVSEDDLETFEATLDQASRSLRKPSLLGTLRHLLEVAQETFQNHPAPDIWGNPARIWDRAPRWLRASDFDLAGVALIRALPDPPAKQLDYLEKALDQLRVLANGGSPGSSAKTLLTNLHTLVSGEKDHISIDRKKFSATPELVSAAQDLLDTVVGTRIRLCLEDTVAMHRILQRYEERYQERVRRHGLLSFADLNRALLGRYLPSGQAHPLDQSLLAWRLDGWFDHWMFDEFQDTSRSQWNAVAPLVDEVIQDPEDRRSTLLVGDTKQAIYGWRGGDPYLFDAISNAYPGRFREESLDQSWRSGPGILECVNTLFGNVSAGGFYPPKAVHRWQSHWHPHASRRPDRDAWAGILQVETDAAIDSALVEQVRAIREALPGASIGILYRKNDDVVDATDFLRAEGIPATREATVRIAHDNTAGKLLLSALRLLDRPADGLARGHLEATGRFNDSWRSARHFCGEGLEVAAARGFADWASRCLDRLLPPETRDPFIEQRIDDLLFSLAEFDAGGDTTPLAAIRHLETATLADPPGQDRVQVMTWHKAKGLSFDATIIPLVGRNRNTVYDASRLHVEADPVSGEGRWILRMPASQILENVPELQIAHENVENTDAHEDLCALYVALTRARQVLTVLLPAKPATRAARMVGTIVQDLAKPEPDEAPASRCGTWAAAFGVWPPGPDFRTPPVVNAPSVIPGGSEPDAVGRLEPESPSSGKPWAGPGSILDDLIHPDERSDPRRFGSEVHEALSRIEWLAAEAPLPPELPDAVVGFLAAPEVRAVFRPPDRETILWREKAFDWFASDRWLSGVFDRVEIHLDASRKPIHAVIFDFKTDQASPDEAARHHHAQMQGYRVALAGLAQIPVTEIEAKLVLLRQNCVVQIP